MREQKDIPDSDMLNAYRNGDNKAFAKLLYRYETSLFTYIFRMVGNKKDAEDIFQEVFLRIINNLENYDEKGKFNSWLFGIAHNLSIDCLRKQKFNRTLFEQNYADENETDDTSFEKYIDMNPLPDTLYEKKELYTHVSKAVNELSLQLKEVFLLREHSELSFKEIAVELNRPLNTVLSQMRQAIIKIRKYLEKYYE